MHRSGDLGAGVSSRPAARCRLRNSLDAGHAYASNWVDQPAEWSAENRARIDAIHAENMPAFRRVLQLVINMRADAP